ncbi:hypothetical protein D3C77_362950 [compost metagenome]
MNKSDQVEYCNLDLRFNRRHIGQLITELIQDGYSLYWSESEAVFIISVRTGRKLTKLRFEAVGSGYKLEGNYVIKDARLAVWFEKLIEDFRGHAVVKRTKNSHTMVENILFGEVITLVEITGMEQRVLYQKEPLLDAKRLEELMTSQIAEQQLSILRQQLDDELDLLHDLLEQGNHEEILACKERLQSLRLQLIALEW